MAAAPYFLNIATHAYTVVHDFGGLNDGSNPCGDLYRASDGFYYGTTRYGYQGAHGAIFRYDIPTHTYTHMTDMVDSLAAYPNFGHLTEYFPAAIPVQPYDVAVCPGTSVSFTASDTTAALPAQWQLSSNGGISYTNIAGATDSVYSLVAQPAQNSYLYRVIFSHPTYNDTSAGAELTVYPTDTTGTSAGICSGSTYSLWGRTFSATGTYADTIFGGSMHGCDSIRLLHLTVYSRDTGYVTATSCYHHFYNYYGYTFYSTGVYTVIRQGAAIHGCDSTVIINLTMLPPDSGTVTAAICAPAWYTVGTHSYYSSGTYYDTIRGAAIHGCDSFVTLHLTVYGRPVTENAVTICQGDSFAFHGQIYYTSNQYTYTMPGASACGTDSIEVLDLYVYQANFGYYAAYMCPGQPYTFGTYVHDTAGNYIDTLFGAGGYGCDSIVFISLFYYSPDTGTITETICAGHSYTLAGHSYTAPGIYADTIRAAGTHGCDSVVTIYLSFYAPATRTITAAICPGHSYSIGSHIHRLPGTYTDTLIAAAIHGCDSIVTLHLSVYAPASDTIEAEICAGGTYAIGNHIYNSPGIYTDTLSGAAVHGCDSIATVRLTIYPAATASITTSICQGESYQIGTHTYTSSSIYIDTLTASSAHGCDSIVTLNLIVTTMSDSASVHGDSCTVTGNGATYQWYDCTTGAAISGAIFSEYTAGANGTYFCVVTLGSCTDTTNCVTVTGVGILDIGTYQFSLYPNPTSGTFIIDNNYTGSLTVEVINILGEKMRTFTMNSAHAQFDISTLAAGMYEVHINDGGVMMKAWKVVKE